MRSYIVIIRLDKNSVYDDEISEVSPLSPNMYLITNQKNIKTEIDTILKYVGPNIYPLHS